MYANNYIYISFFFFESFLLLYTSIYLLSNIIRYKEAHSSSLPPRSRYSPPLHSTTISFLLQLLSSPPSPNTHKQNPYTPTQTHTRFLSHAPFPTSSPPRMLFCFNTVHSYRHYPSTSSSTFIVFTRTIPSPPTHSNTPISTHR